MISNTHIDNTLGKRLHERRYLGSGCRISNDRHKINTAMHSVNETLDHYFGQVSGVRHDQAPREPVLFHHPLVHGDATQVYLV